MKKLADVRARINETNKENFVRRRLYIIDENVDIGDNPLIINDADAYMRRQSP